MSYDVVNNTTILTIQKAIFYSDGNKYIFNTSGYIHFGNYLCQIALSIYKSSWKIKKAQLINDNKSLSVDILKSGSKYRIKIFIPGILKTQNSTELSFHNYTGNLYIKIRNCIPKRINANKDRYDSLYAQHNQKNIVYKANPFKPFLGGKWSPK